MKLFGSSRIASSICRVLGGASAGEADESLNETLFVVSLVRRDILPCNWNRVRVAVEALQVPSAVVECLLSKHQVSKW